MTMILCWKMGWADNKVKFSFFFGWEAWRKLGREHWGDFSSLEQSLFVLLLMPLGTRR